MNSIPLRGALTLGITLSPSMFAPALFAAPDRPNVLLLIADDYGADSHPLYNSDPAATFAPTPNLDALMARGIRFSDCFAYPTCSPTRSAMLTGRHAFRTAVGYALETTNDPALTPFELTIPECLQLENAAYDCAMFGKWHCSLGNGDPNSIGGFPLFVGNIHGGFRAPTETYFEWPIVSNGVASTCTNYATTETTDNAIRWIQSRNPESNWFCWVAYNAAHTPFHKPPDALCPSYAHLPGNNLDVSARPRLYQEAMTEAMDSEIGRLLSHVDLEHTLVLFLGDNGTLGLSPVSENRIIQPPYDVNRAKGTLYQGALRVPMFAAGAGVSNAPRVCTHPISVVDFFSTILEVAGVDPSHRYGPHRPLDSVSFASVLRETNAPPPRSWVLAENFSSHTESNRAGRCLLDDRFKFISFQDGNKAFFEIAADPLELTNLYGHALSPEQSNALASLERQLGELQNVPFVSQVGGMPVEIAVSFVNDVDFSLSAAFSPTGAWESVAAATIATNETDVLFGGLPDLPSHRFYRASAPAR